MKKQLFFGLSLCAVLLFTGCKSQESAYRQAYNKAKAQQTETTTDAATTVATTTTNDAVQVTPITTTPVAATDHSDVRTIDGGVTVVSGNSLKTYSVVVGSFVTQANAEGLMTRLRNKGYDSRVVKTNETINGQTGWFRVIASSYTDKASAAQSRDGLKSEYPGAWLLYTK